MQAITSLCTCTSVQVLVEEAKHIQWNNEIERSLLLRSIIASLTLSLLMCTSPNSTIGIKGVQIRPMTRIMTNKAHKTSLTK